MRSVAESTEESLGKGTLTKLAALPVACLTSHVIVLAAVPIAPRTSPSQFSPNCSAAYERVLENELLQIILRFPCSIMAWQTIEAIVLNHVMRRGVAVGFSRSPSGDSLQFVSLLLVIEL